MRETIQISASDSGDQGLIEAISDLDYAATMHFGDIRDVFGNGTIAVIPARPFLDINSGKEEEYQDIYLNQIEQAWNANTFDF